MNTVLQHPYKHNLTSSPKNTVNTYGISRREKEVLTALADGFSQKQIALQLYIATNTVNTHIQKIYQKLNVHSAPGAVGKALREGVID